MFMMPDKTSPGEEFKLQMANKIMIDAARSSGLMIALMVGVLPSPIHDRNLLFGALLNDLFPDGGEEDKCLRGLIDKFYANVNELVDDLIKKRRKKK